MLLFVIGIGVGLLGAIVGIGGGIFVVPILLSIYLFSPQLAVGTSLFVVALNALSGTIGYARQTKQADQAGSGLIDWRAGVAVIVASAPGVALGAYASSFFPSPAFRLVFAVVLVATAGHLVFGRDTKSGTEGRQVEIPPKTGLMALISVVAGFISALLGIGGGIIYVPALMCFLNMPVRSATATSQFILLNTACLSLLPQVWWGNVDYGYGLLMGAGAVVGAQAGVFLSPRIRSRVIVLVLGCMLVIAAVKLLLF